MEDQNKRIGSDRRSPSRPIVDIHFAHKAKRKSAFVTYRSNRPDIEDLQSESSDSEEFIIDIPEDHEEAEEKQAKLAKKKTIAIVKMFKALLPQTCCWGLCFTSLRTGLFMLSISYFACCMIDLLIMIYDGASHTLVLTSLFVVKMLITISLILLEVFASGYAYIVYKDGDLYSLKLCLLIHFPHALLSGFAIVWLLRSKHDEYEEMDETVFMAELVFYSASCVQIFFASIHIYSYQLMLKSNMKHRKKGHRKVKRYFETG